MQLHSFSHFIVTAFLQLQFISFYIFTKEKSADNSNVEKYNNKGKTDIQKEQFLNKGIRNTLWLSKVNIKDKILPVLHKTKNTKK